MARVLRFRCHSCSLAACTGQICLGALLQQGFSLHDIINGLSDIRRMIANALEIL
jgi:hypothetical protein